MRLPFSWLRWGLLFLVGVMLFLGVNAWRHGTSLNPLLRPLPQSPDIQVYFNHSQSAVYTDPYRQRSRLGDDLEQIIIDTIASAQSSIDLAVQELHLPRVAAALRDRYQAGVKVRIVLEHDYNRRWSEVTPQTASRLEDHDRSKYEEFIQLGDRNQDGHVDAIEAEQSDSILIVQKAQIPLIDDTADGSKGSALMHHKFMVVDQKLVLTGSVNYSLSDVHGDFLASESEGNANHLLKINSPALAQLFSQEFAILWGDGPGGKPDSYFGLQKPYRLPQTIMLPSGSSIAVQFSPTSTSRPWDYSVNGFIGRVLNTATQTIDMALFVLSEQNLSNQLEGLHQRGVSIRALIDAQFAYRNYSEALDMMGVALADDSCQFEPGNQPWSGAIATVGVPQMPEGDLLHHKFGVVDKRLVITGSHNWTAAANTSNDENLLVISDPTIAAHFQREFERLYATAILGVPPQVQDKIRQQKARCSNAHFN
ncbi:MAG: phospholipase D-like domain-containing protein [Oculatellaceae cyanobacterium bins.114]|nr:phospholipase D-like domain-containing protein [Oculatellaceae cyanobacterium bins.114]